FFSSRRRHARWPRDWSSDVCSSDLASITACATSRSHAGAFLPLAWLLDVAHAVMLALMVPLEWLADLPMAMLETHAPAAWTVAEIGRASWREREKHPARYGRDKDKK